MVTVAASSYGAGGSVTCFTLGKNLRSDFSVASATLATPGSIDFHALLTQPIFSARAFNSIDGEYVNAALSTGSVERSSAV